jgi:hypothetical protein
VTTMSEYVNISTPQPPTLLTVGSSGKSMEAEKTEA